MKNWNDYDLNELGSIVSDYHKDMYGFRPRAPGLYDDKARLVSLAESLDQRFDRLKETFAGREELRASGWVVEETEPKLIQRAQWLAEEREREFAESEAMYGRRSNPFED